MRWKKWPGWRGPALTHALNQKYKELVLQKDGRYIDGLGTEKWAAKDCAPWLRVSTFMSEWERFFIRCWLLSVYGPIWCRKWSNGWLGPLSVHQPISVRLCPQVIQTISAVDKDNPSQGHTFHYRLEMLNNPNFTIKNNLGKKNTWPWKRAWKNRTSICKHFVSNTVRRHFCAFKWEIWRN